MKKKDIETRFTLQQGSINTLYESYYDLFRRVKSLECTRDAFLSNDIKTPNQARENVGMNKLDTNLYIDAYELSKNRCPHCGSHHLFYEFHGNSLEDSKVYCKDCGNQWQFGKSDVAEINPYEKNKCLKGELERARDRIKIQKSEVALLENKNKKLEEELDGFKNETYSYLKEICDKQQVKIKTFEDALKVLFDKFHLESKILGDGEILNNLIINATGFINDKYSGYKTLVNIDNKEFSSLIEAWHLLRKNK